MEILGVILYNLGMNFVYNFGGIGSMDLFNLQRNSWNNEPMISIAGQFTSQNIPEFRAIVDDMASAVPQRILVDMQNLNFIDSLGIGVLIFYHNNLRRSGVQLALFRPSDAIEEILRLTSLDRVIPIQK